MTERRSPDYPVHKPNAFEQAQALVMGQSFKLGNELQSIEQTVSPLGNCAAYVDECQDFQFESDDADTYGGVAGDRLTEAEERIRRSCTFVDGCWLKSNAFSSIFAEMKSQEAPNA